jgi:uncharacterized protein YjiS (DUF1127 family)
MMVEGRFGEHRSSSLGYARDERRRAILSRSATAIAPVLRFAGPEKRRGDTGHIALLTVIRRFAAAIRLRRARARSRHQLRELSDHLLKDIGLRREVLVYEFPMPLLHCD